MQKQARSTREQRNSNRPKKSEKEAPANVAYEPITMKPCVKVANSKNVKIDGKD
jgi:hypothetical protein